jgi:hypothetical protein
MIYRILADAVIVLHLLFVMFAVAGGFVVVFWRYSPVVHLPVVVWGMVIACTELSCPLTPLENWLWSHAGAHGYEGGFVAHYLGPIVHPVRADAGLGPAAGIFLVAINVVVYSLVIVRRRRSHGPAEPNVPGLAG